MYKFNGVGNVKVHTDILWNIVVEVVKDILLRTQVHEYVHWISDSPLYKFFSSSSLRWFFFQKVWFVFQISKKNYSKSLSWTWNLNFPPLTVNNKFKFQAHDSFLKYFYFGDWEIWKMNHNFLKKATFTTYLNLVLST